MNPIAKILAGAGVFSLTACAAAPEKAYPSLALRDAEYEAGNYTRPTGDCIGQSGEAQIPEQGQFEPAPAPPPPAPPPALSTNLAERIVQLEEQARAAHADFEQSLPATRSAVRARGAVGSKSWGRAEVAFANLRAIRARTAIPAADLDALVATRSVSGEQVDTIITARDAVALLLEQEDTALSELALRR